MSLSRREVDDKPLFYDSNNDEIDRSFSNAQKLSIEEINNREENNRKNRIIDFCIKAALWLALFSIVMIAADMFAQCKGFETSLIKDCFSLVTYLATAASGFLFGSNSK